MEPDHDRVSELILRILLPHRRSMEEHDQSEHRVHTCFRHQHQSIRNIVLVAPGFAAGLEEANLLASAIAHSQRSSTSL